MAPTAIKWLLILLIIFAFKASDQSKIPTTIKANPSNSTSTPTTTTTENTTDDKTTYVEKEMPHPSNKGLLKRMLYVAVGCSLLVALYFIVKTIRTKAKKSKSKKYGMIYSSGDVEMQPLDKDDDDEDDLTLFDRKARK